MWNPTFVIPEDCTESQQYDIFIDVAEALLELLARQLHLVTQTEEAGHFLLRLGSSMNDEQK